MTLSLLRQSVSLWLSLILLSFLISCGPDEGGQSGVDLIPDTVNPSPDYWCTWGAQNFAADTVSLLNSLSLGGHSITARHVNEEQIFSEGGWSDAFPEELRGDLLMVFDVGWDVSSGTSFDDSRWKLGSMEVAEDKFPSCRGNRQDKLIQLNRLVRSHGWKGTGLWLPSHPYTGDPSNESLSKEETGEFYRLAALESKQAGISYWKIDYGSRGGDISFRSMITSTAGTYSPGLWVEHGRGSGPLNDEACPWDTENYYGTGSYRRWDDGKALESAVAIAHVSHVLRTYDITQQLSIPTTLDRVSEVLGALSGSGDSVIINCEDEPYIGAVLGCALGIMRHPDMIYMEGKDYDPFRFKYRIDEVMRAVRWHRIAPAWGGGLDRTLLDTARLEDSWMFRDGDGWATWVTGREIIQTAPSRVARGMELPEVSSEGPAPYVICSRHPNGAVAIATLPRVHAPQKIFHPDADILINIGDPGLPVAVFGRYGSLTLELANGEYRNITRVMAQDLAGEEASDITALVSIQPNGVTIPGETIEKIGLSASSPDDLSEPGMILIMETVQQSKSSRGKQN